MVKLSAAEKKRILRALEVARMAAGGMSVSEIALEMGVTGATVTNYLSEWAEVESEAIANVDRWRAQELHRRQQVISFMWPGVEKGDAQCASIVLKASEMITKLTGADIKTDESGDIATPGWVLNLGGKAAAKTGDA